MAETLIRTSGLHKIHKTAGAKVLALQEISLEIRRGEFVSVMGPSGSGKSTLVNILGLLDRASAGKYYFEEDDTSRFTPDRMAAVRNRRIGFVFQSFKLLARYTALENVELPLVYAGIGRRARRERASRALDAVGLGKRLRHWPHQLSGGEQQRVAIARALVVDPALILADEPTGALDSRTGLALMAELQRLNAAGRTIVMVTHDINLAQHAGRRIELADGRMTLDTATRSLLADDFAPTQAALVP